MCNGLAGTWGISQGLWYFGPGGWNFWPHKKTQLLGWTAATSISLPDHGVRMTNLRHSGWRLLGWASDCVSSRDRLLPQELASALPETALLKLRRMLQWTAGRAITAQHHPKEPFLINIMESGEVEVWPWGNPPPPREGLAFILHHTMRAGHACTADSGTVCPILINMPCHGCCRRLIISMHHSA